jgi:predicted extracellular nuclease
LDCRGANTATELSRQRQKILAALSAINADVVGLNELENNSSAAIADLVNGLNALLGTGTYSYVNTGTIGTDAIKVGLIYKSSRVALVGSHAILNSSVDSDFIDTLNRPVLAQTFRHVGTSEVFTVAVNHLKSKGSACAGDPDTGDLQGNCNLTRLAAAEAEAAWLASDPTNSDDPDFLLIGDFNSYAKEDPIAALEAANYVSLVPLFLGPNAYSYVFEGQSGYLDHAFASSHLANKIGKVTEWHVNADEPRMLDYNQEFNPAYLFQPNAYRSADHDPIIVDFKAPNAVPMPRWGMSATAGLLLVLGALLSGGRRRKGSVE